MRLFIAANDAPDIPIGASFVLTHRFAPWDGGNMQAASFVRLAIAGGAALALYAAPVSAQGTFNYFTTGQFTSSTSTCNATTDASVATCMWPGSGGLVLTFTGDGHAPNGYMSGTQLTYGVFSTGGTGTLSSVPSDAMFRLVINQIDPTTGSASIVGSIGGQLAAGPGGSFSSLFWLPSSTTVTIHGVTYTLDDSQGMPLDSLTIGANFNTSLNGHGYVSTVPEPSTLALLGSGLVGLVPVVRRRRH